MHDGKLWSKQIALSVQYKRCTAVDNHVFDIQLASTKGPARGASNSAALPWLAPRADMETVLSICALLFSWQWRGVAFVAGKLADSKRRLVARDEGARYEQASDALLLDDPVIAASPAGGRRRPRTA